MWTAVLRSPGQLDPILARTAHAVPLEYIDSAPKRARSLLLSGSRSVRKLLRTYMVIRYRHGSHVAAEYVDLFGPSPSTAAKKEQQRPGVDIGGVVMRGITSTDQRCALAPKQRKSVKKARVLYASACLGKLTSGTLGAAAWAFNSIKPPFYAALPLPQIAESQPAQSKHNGRYGQCIELIIPSLANLLF
ncbi:hypothetical protein VDGL01_00969 [Verticillium dahliae]